MVIISKMDTQHNILYLPSESNHVMSTNRKVGHLLFIMLIIVPFSPNTRGAFYSKYHTFTYSFVFKKSCFNYLKQNLKSSRRLLSQNIFDNFSDSHLLLKSTTFKGKHQILDQVSTYSTLCCCSRSHQGSPTFACAS